MSSSVILGYYIRVEPVKKKWFSSAFALFGFYFRVLRYRYSSLFSRDFSWLSILNFTMNLFDMIRLIWAFAMIPLIWFWFAIHFDYDYVMRFCYIMLWEHSVLSCSGSILLWIALPCCLICSVLMPEFTNYSWRYNGRVIEAPMAWHYLGRCDQSPASPSVYDIICGQSVYVWGDVWMHPRCLFVWNMIWYMIIVHSGDW